MDRSERQRCEARGSARADVPLELRAGVKVHGPVPGSVTEKKKALLGVRKVFSRLPNTCSPSLFGQQPFGLESGRLPGRRPVPRCGPESVLASVLAFLLALCCRARGRTQSRCCWSVERTAWSGD